MGRRRHHLHPSAIHTTLVRPRHEACARVFFCLQLKESIVSYPLYKNRRPDVVDVNFWLTREAAELLRLYCPEGRKRTGEFLGRLLFEHHARRREMALLLHACETPHEGRPEECRRLLRHLREEEPGKRQEERRAGARGTPEGSPAGMDVGRTG